VIIGTEGDTHVALHSKQFISCKRPLTPYMVGNELGIPKSKDEARNRRTLANTSATEGTQLASFNTLGEIC